MGRIGQTSGGRGHESDLSQIELGLLLSLLSCHEIRITAPSLLHQGPADSAPLRVLLCGVLVPDLELALWPEAGPSQLLQQVSLHFGSCWFSSPWLRKEILFNFNLGGLRSAF